MSALRALVFALHVFFVLALCPHTPRATFFFCPPPPPPSSPTNTFVVYVQATFANGTNNFTAFPVAGINGKEFSVTQFGTFYVDDDYITATASPTSAMLGRSQGTITVTGLVGGRLQVSLTLVFTSGLYNGSTLVLLGSANPIPQVAQVAVVGGTNNFTFATGFAELQPLNGVALNQVIKTTVTYKI
ncbi:hypothetical protein MLD38_029272 [Melastoma candidum]|uniref:Uncharacterized protein n=1 Tax=Melastoma candidum TaxID=119954 RepID=A0ACB9N3L7_9MYRT|nr:hypothetical protein MLD38_029272 [Melastoma candidum]